MTNWLGPGLVLLFCVSQAFRDVYFGHVFQKIDFFLVILVAFLLSTLIFAVTAVIRTPSDFRRLRGHGQTIVAMNLTTALAWSCYFFGLTHIEPSIVNTLHSGMGPLTVVALAAFGAPLAKSPTVRWGEYIGYAGMALSLAGLWWVVLARASGLAATNPTTSLSGLALLVVSGGSITISLLYCKRLQDAGISAEVVTALRYVALIALAAVMVLTRADTIAVPTMAELAMLSALTTVLIVLPLFALQVGIGLTAPLTANVLRALGPVFVFALEQVDGRMTYSTPTLLCILVYSASAIVSNVAHAWGGPRMAPMHAVSSARS